MDSLGRRCFDGQEAIASVYLVSQKLKFVCAHIESSSPVVCSVMDSKVSNILCMFIKCHPSFHENMPFFLPISPLMYLPICLRPAPMNHTHPGLSSSTIFPITPPWHSSACGSHMAISHWKLTARVELADRKCPIDRRPSFAISHQTFPEVQITTFELISLIETDFPIFIISTLLEEMDQ